MDGMSSPQVSPLNVKTAQLLLKIIYGVVPIVAGLDKFFNILVDWSIYTNPVFNTWIPMVPDYAIYVIGAIEITAGVLVLIHARLGGYVVAAWLTLIAINLIATGKFYDIAVRDLAMATGSLALALLSK